MPRKTIKRRTQNFERNMVEMFLSILTTIKLFHWRTTVYALHKATDDLHSKLSGLVDSFVEVLLGKSESRITGFGKSLPISDCGSLENFKKEINIFKHFLINLNKSSLQYPQNDNADLFTIRDEMLKEVNQFLYLSTFI